MIRDVFEDHDVDGQGMGWLGREQKERHDAYPRHAILSLLFIFQII